MTDIYESDYLNRVQHCWFREYFFPLISPKGLLKVFVKVL